MLRFAHRFAVFVAVLFTLTATRDVRADAASAQALFDQAKKLMAEKKYAEACPKFEESNKQDPGLGTQMNLALCWASMGRTASAWSMYLDVASQAKAQNQPDREKKARDAAKELEPKLVRLTIEVPTAPDGIEVKRNNAVVGQPTWGTPIPVDPGEIKISAAAPNKKLWETTVKVEKADETVTVPELEKGQPPPGFGQQPGAGYPPPGYPMPPRMKRRSGGLFGGGIAMVSVGSLGVLVGGLWLAVAGSDAIGGDLGTPAAVTLVSAAMLGGGIAMIVIGGKKVPVEAGAATKTNVLAPFSPVPEVRVGLGSFQAKWEF